LIACVAFQQSSFPSNLHIRAVDELDPLMTSSVNTSFHQPVIDELGRGNTQPLKDDCFDRLWRMIKGKLQLTQPQHVITSHVKRISSIQS
jgi:hypothetical protein